MKIEDSESFWNTVWTDQHAIAYWRKMSPDVVALAELNDPAERPNVLDIGCGAGRNAIAFAERGFAVTATDISETAIASTQEWAKKKGVRISKRQMRPATTA